VSGTPGTAGGFSFVVRVDDAGGQAAGVPRSINVAPALTATGRCTQSCAVEQGCVTVCGTYTDIAGGVTPDTYALTGGTLPPGTSLNGVSLAGTFTTISATAPFSFAVTITDALGATSSVNAGYSVFPHISLASGTCYGNFFTGCSGQLKISGGTPNATPTVTLLSESQNPNPGPLPTSGTCWTLAATSPPPGYGLTAGAGLVTVSIPSGISNGYGAVWTLMVTSSDLCGPGLNCSSPTATVTIGSSAADHQVLIPPLRAQPGWPPHITDPGDCVLDAGWAYDPGGVSKEGKIGVGLGLVGVAGLGGLPAGAYLGWFQFTRPEVVAIFAGSAILALVGLGLVVHALVWHSPSQLAVDQGIAQPVAQAPKPLEVHEPFLITPYSGVRSFEHWVGIYNPPGNPPAVHTRIEIVDMKPPPKNDRGSPGVFPSVVPMKGDGNAALGITVPSGRDELWNFAKSSTSPDDSIWVQGVAAPWPFRQGRMWPFEPDERWRLLYQVTADNFPVVQFTIVMVAVDHMIQCSLQS
jgi:hypothetical protein